MKRFYETYREYEKLQTLSAEISWSHNVLILQKTNTKVVKERLNHYGTYLYLDCNVIFLEARGPREELLGNAE